MLALGHDSGRRVTTSKSQSTVIVSDQRLRVLVTGEDFGLDSSKC
jgi:hypothetical protein